MTRNNDGRPAENWTANQEILTAHTSVATTDVDTQSGELLLKTYRRHYCQVQHRTWGTATRCIWAWASLCGGNLRHDHPTTQPVYVLLSKCGGHWGMSIWGDYASARECDRGLRHTGCGHGCYLDSWANHEIVAVAPLHLLRPGERHPRRRLQSFQRASDAYRGVR